MFDRIKKYFAADSRVLRIKQKQMRQARLELAHFEELQETLNSYVTRRRVTIKRLEKELAKAPRKP